MSQVSSANQIANLAPQALAPDTFYIAVYVAVSVALANIVVEMGWNRRISF